MKSSFHLIYFHLHNLTKLTAFFLLVLSQGVLEAIRISCAGYPTKRAFDEFLDRFGMLAPDVLDGYNYQNKHILV